MLKKLIIKKGEIGTSRLFRSFKLIGIVGSTQAFLQAINLLTGILIIRMLPTREYAYYTIANTMLGTMVLLSDGGVGIGVMSEGGKVWQDEQKLSGVLNTGLHLRKLFGAIALVIVVPILLYLLHRNKASFVESVIIVVALIPAFVASLSDSILEIVPKLHQDLKPLQKNQILVGIARLGLSGIGLFLLPLTVISFLANALPRIIGNIQLRKITSKYIELKSTQVNKDTKNSILKIVKRSLPSALYYCFVGQISLWIISVFGKITSVAAIGALSRIAFITNLMAIIFSMLITPRFARMREEKKALLRSYVSSQVLLALALTFMTFSTWLFSSYILKILGDSYQNLQTELVLCIISSSLAVMTGASLNLYNSRGWVINPIVNIVVNLSAIVLGVLIFDLTSLKSVLLLGIFIAFVEFSINATFGAIKILKLRGIE